MCSQPSSTRCYNASNTPSKSIFYVISNLIRICDEKVLGLSQYIRLQKKQESREPSHLASNLQPVGFSSLHQIMTACELSCSPLRFFVVEEKLRAIFSLSCFFFSLEDCKASIHSSNKLLTQKIRENKPVYKMQIDMQSPFFNDDGSYG